MVQVKNESLKAEVAKLPERIQKEWGSVCQYYSSKTDIQVFEEFKNRWDEFKGPAVEEFLSVSNAVYIQWKLWMYKNHYDAGFKKTLTEVWNEFKVFWELDIEESKVMFKEMELLSENMLDEWRMKYNFDYPHVYERDDNHWSCVQRDYHLKLKAQLWDEFKEIWEIDTSDYNEDKYKEMSKYVSEIQCEDSDKFFSYCEDANYHSFDSYSLLEQFEICEQYEQYNPSESEYDSEDDSEYISDSESEW
jgi:hypothetical protein